jgi:hypothetical protein
MRATFVLLGETHRELGAWSFPDEKIRSH